MRSGFLVLAALLLTVVCTPRSLIAQIEPGSHDSGRNEMNAGYTYLSNSFNNYASFSGGGLSGWEAGASFPLIHGFAVKAEALGFYGNSLGDSQVAHFVLAGGQYRRRFGKESVFVHGLAGIGHINDAALALGGEGPSSNFSLAADVGAGLDTPFARRLAWRVAGSMLRSNFTAASDQIHGLPNLFARLSTGIVWRF
jgi:hypothetical protein